MRRFWSCCLSVLAAVLLCGPALATGPTLKDGHNTPLKPLVTGLKNPESACIGPDRRIYVSTIGEFDKDGDGAVMVIQDGKAVPFATGLDDPKGMVWAFNFLFVADKTRIWRIDRKGKATVFVSADKFPVPPIFLNDMEVVTGAFPFGSPPSLYVSDSGKDGKGGAVYRIDFKGKATTLVDAKKYPEIKTPNGLHMASEYHLHMVDSGSGDLYRIRLADGHVDKISGGFKGGDGVCHDNYGRLYVSSWELGKLWVRARPESKPVLLAEGFESAADCCLSADGKSILVPDMKAGTLTAVPAVVPGAPVDERPVPVTTERAFPDLEWAGWSGTTASGKIVAQRPLVLTHANDDSNRVFVATEHGVIHVFPNDQKAKKTKIFLDIQKQVSYNDNQNEEGFLGLAFSPKYKTDGSFYVFYTTKQRGKGKEFSGKMKGFFKSDPQLTNVVSRFRVSKDDPDRADPATEEVLIRFEKPYWNHDGGTLCFGPDGYLYITHGDGGAANDPYGHGQSLSTLLGKVLRIDVGKKEGDLPYAIPKDNPFVGTKGARGEIWAYGLRNIWRMSFDRKTGELWAADVGQNLWEEIDLIVKGGNYGWNLREGLHPFGVKGVGPRKDLIDPIWEYHHDVGKSMTGGHVYRGKRVPALEGLYLYGDYVSGTMWALRYDHEKKRVTENHVVRQGGFPIYSYGEDDKGEVYFLTSTPNGKGIYRFAPSESGEVIPDWQLPPGVNRGLWDYIHDAGVARGYDASLAGSSLFDVDRAFVERHRPQPGRLIDLGCGTGRLLIPFAQRGWRVLGVDLSAGMLAVAADKARQAGVCVDLLRASLTELDCLGPATLDAAACLFSTLGMVVGADMRRRVVAHAYRLLRPGGIFILHVHNRWFNFHDPTGRRWLLADLLRQAVGTAPGGDRVMPAHQGIAGLTLHLFTRREAVRLLREAGFRMVEVRPISLRADGSVRWAWWFGWLRAYGYLVAARR